MSETPIHALLTEARRLEGERTPGPFKAMLAGNCEMEDGRLASIAEVEGLPRPWNPVWVGWRAAKNYFKTFMRQADAEWVAFWGTHAPAILAYVGELELERDEWERRADHAKRQKVIAQQERHDEHDKFLVEQGLVMIYKADRDRLAGEVADWEQKYSVVLRNGASAVERGQKDFERAEKAEADVTRLTEQLEREVTYSATQTERLRVVEATRDCYKGDLGKAAADASRYEASLERLREKVRNVSPIRRLSPEGIDPPYVVYCCVFCSRAHDGVMKDAHDPSAHFSECGYLEAQR